MSDKSTEFKEPVSLDAIFAATAKAKEAAVIETKVEKVAEKITKPDEVVETKPAEEKVIEEPKVEAPKSKVEEKPIVQPKVEKETEAFKTAQRLIKLGTLEDFAIQTSEDDENGTPISEFKTMTDEDLEEILKIQKQEKEEKISSNYISKEGLKEHQLKVIEILKAGGDLSQIADSKEQAFERPFEGMDLEKEQDQIDILFTDMIYSKKLSEEDAKVLINQQVTKGTLKESATKVFDTYRDSHSKYIDEKLLEQKKKKEFKDITFKENKKALTAKLKEVGMKESVYKKITAEYAKKNKQGEFVLVDKLKEILNNPEENHEIILHLADKKSFNDLFKIKASQGTQRKIVQLANKTANKGNRQTIQKQVTDAGDAPWALAAHNYNNLKSNN